MASLYANYKCPRCNREHKRWIQDSGLPCMIESYFQCTVCDAWIRMKYAFEFAPRGAIVRVMEVTEWNPDLPAMDVKVSKKTKHSLLLDDEE